MYTIADISRFGGQAVALFCLGTGCDAGVRLLFGILGCKPGVGIWLGIGIGGIGGIGIGGVRVEVGWVGFWEE